MSEHWVVTGGTDEANRFVQQWMNEHMPTPAEIVRVLVLYGGYPEIPMSAEERCTECGLNLAAHSRTRTGGWLVGHPFACPVTT